MAEEVLTKVGKKGEIYTTRRLRRFTGLLPGTRILLRASKTGLLVERIAAVEELIKDCFVEVTPEEAEELSKEAQKGVTKTIGRKAVT